MPDKKIVDVHIKMPFGHLNSLIKVLAVTELAQEHRNIPAREVIHELIEGIKKEDVHQLMDLFCKVKIDADFMIAKPVVELEDDSEPIDIPIIVNRKLL